MPLLIADGWISAGSFAGVYGHGWFDVKGTTYIVESADTGKKDNVTIEYYRFPLPAGFRDLENGDAVSLGVRIKKHNNGFYFNIEDLFKEGILTKY